MKRRSFLAMLGLAPVAAAAAAVKAAATETQQIRIEATPSDHPLVDYPKRATSAEIGQVTGGIIRTKDGSLCLDLGAGTISWQA